MSTKLQICQRALIEIGDAPITSLTQGTPAANACNDYFEIIAREVIREGSWTSTLKRVALVDSGVTPVFEYGEEYNLPSDFIKLIKVNEDYPEQVDHKIEGTKLVTNETSIDILYVADISSSPEDFDQNLETAVVYKLAGFLAFYLTANRALRNDLYAAYERELTKGLAHDGQQGSRSTIYSNLFRGIK